MKKIPKRSVLLNRLHKGFVLGCIGITALGTIYLGTAGYNYFMVHKPKAKELKLLEKQQLLAEGSSDNLQDAAPTLKL